MNSADEVIAALGLLPLPVEGGYFRETHRSVESTAIFFLLTPSTCSLLHRLTGDEVYHFYLGDPVEMLLLKPDRSSTLIVLGNQINVDQHIQHVVRAGWWQGSRLREGGRWALMGTTMAPPFEVKNFELGDRRTLSREHPDRAELIEKLTKSA